MEIVRLLISRFGVGNRIDGRMIIRVITGMPSIVILFDSGGKKRRWRSCVCFLGRGVVFVEKEETKK